MELRLEVSGSGERVSMPVSPTCCTTYVGILFCALLPEKAEKEARNITYTPSFQGFSMRQPTFFHVSCITEEM